MSDRLHTIVLGVIGCVVLAAVVGAFLFTNAADQSARNAAILGMLLVAGNTLAEQFFIDRVVWRGQSSEGVPRASTAGLPFGKNYQLGLLGLALIVSAAVTYMAVDLPASNQLVLMVLGIQAAAGCVLAGRGFFIREVIFDSHLHTMVTGYLIVNAVLCIIALTSVGGYAWWQPAICLHLFWVLVGFTHHLRPLREWIRRQA
jgi:hypothetical protein